MIADKGISDMTREFWSTLTSCASPLCDGLWPALPSCSRCFQRGGFEHPMKRVTLELVAEGRTCRLRYWVLPATYGQRATNSFMFSSFRRTEPFLFFFFPSSWYINFILSYWTFLPILSPSSWEITTIIDNHYFTFNPYCVSPLPLISTNSCNTILFISASVNNI